MKHLSPYQEEAREFLLQGKFRCLFDEPGVGKTGPAIMAGWEVRKNAFFHTIPVLVTCPAYLIPNWEQEIKDFIPDATVVRADGAGYEARRQALSVDVDFVLTSYNNWSARHPEDHPQEGELKYPELSKQEWSAYIFDEGHRLRGRNSSATQHVFSTRLGRSRNVDTPIWILSGTPFVRDGGDFFPYFKLYDKKKYGSYWTFVDDRCVVITTPWGKDVRNIRKAYAEEFRRELAQFSLRRTVQDIPELSSLEFTETDYFVNLPKSVLEMFKKAKKEYVLEHEHLPRSQFLNGAGALYVLQRKNATVPPTVEKPKIEWLHDFLNDKKGKVVVYVWFKDSARHVFDSLSVLKSETKSRPDKHYLITGDTAPQKRQAIVDNWRRNGRVLVATIPSLKEGISLTEARDVVFLEHSELPSDIEQCIKRLCRRGQTDLVQVHHVHARASVDMSIKKVLESRGTGSTDALSKWMDLEEDDDWFT